MANQQTPSTTAGDNGLGFSAQQLSVLKMLIEEMKKPYVDPDETAKKEKARQRLREQRDEAEAQIAAIQSSCNHLRDDNTSRVAWITNWHRSRNLYITEGFCQMCNKHFHPGVDGYEQMLRVPVGKAGLIM